MLFCQWLGGTFSEVVETVHKRLIERHPDLKWKLKKADFSNGWYQCEFYTVSKDKQYNYQNVKFAHLVYLVRKCTDGTWQYREEI